MHYFLKLTTFQDKHMSKMANKLKVKLSTRTGFNFNFELRRLE